MQYYFRKSRFYNIESINTKKIDNQLVFSYEQENIKYLFEMSVSDCSNRDDAKLRFQKSFK